MHWTNNYMDEIQRLCEEGNNHYFANNFVEAKLCFEKVLEQVKDNIYYWHNHAMACSRLNEHDAAIKSFEYPISKEFFESYIGRGSTYRLMGKYKEALRDFAMAFVIEPTHSAAYSNYGNSLREFGRPDIAIPFLQAAVNLNDNDHHFKLNLAVSYLMLGDFDIAWKYYDSRWYFDSDQSQKPVLPGPEFDGTQNIENKNILVYGEQGLGDHIQFSRYIYLLEDLKANVIFACRPPLVNFFTSNFPKSKVNSMVEESIAYDYHVPLMSLPKIFKTTIDTIPFSGKYLNASPTSIDKWSKRLGPKNKMHIGINWAGNKNAFITKFRKLPLNDMLRLNSSNVQLVNLYYDITEEEKAILTKNNILDFSSELTDFDDEAGLIANMDLVVTVDTVTAHLAGALGIPTWVMLADYGCDWRWFLERSDSPFYSCVKLFRKKENEDWSAVLDQVRNILDKLS